MGLIEERCLSKGIYDNMRFKIPMRDGKWVIMPEAGLEERETVWMKFLKALRDFHIWLKASEHTKESNPEFWAVQLKIPSETLALPASTPTDILSSASQHVPITAVVCSVNDSFETSRFMDSHTQWGDNLPMSTARQREGQTPGMVVIDQPWCPLHCLSHLFLFTACIHQAHTG